MLELVFVMSEGALKYHGILFWLNIVTINTEKFQFVPLVQFIMYFQHESFKQVQGLQISLPWSIFEQKRCSLFHQKKV